MHVRIYFLIVILTSFIIGTFMDEKISSLTVENEALRKSLKAKESDNRPDRVADPRLFNFHSVYSVGLEGPLTSKGDLSEGGDMEGFLEQAEEKMDIIEASLKQYRHEALGYQTMIDALKNEINIKDGELQELRITIARYKDENEVLVRSLKEKERDLTETIAMLNERKNEAELEKKVQVLSRSLRIAEAEACYSRARLTEMAAQKILFSPVRKKEYLKEALEGYKKAYSLGKSEAAREVSKLQRSLSPGLASVN